MLGSILNTTKIGQRIADIRWKCAIRKYQCHLDNNLGNPKSNEGLLGRNFSSAMLTPTAPGVLDFCTRDIKYN
jgi:hypothetical protein